MTASFSPPTPNAFPPPDSVTVAEVLRWYERNCIRPGSPGKAIRERKRLWDSFSQVCGEMRVTECRPYVLLHFLNEHGKHLSAWSRKRWNVTIQRPFNYACELGLTDKNPFRGLRMPKGNQGRDWTEGEYRAVLRAAPAYLRRLFVFIRFSGARPGESRQMKWSNVKETLSAIVIDDHKTKHLTDKPRRIPLNSVVVNLLTWLKVNNPPGKQHVFLNSYRNGWSLRTLTDRFAKIREKAGLPADFKLHGGRHTFATTAVMNGVDIVTLAELLGHASVLSTQRYIHLRQKTPHLNVAMEKAIGKRSSGRDEPDLTPLPDPEPIPVPVAPRPRRSAEIAQRDATIAQLLVKMRELQHQLKLRPKRNREHGVFTPAWEQAQFASHWAAEQNPSLRSNQAHYALIKSRPDCPFRVPPSYFGYMKCLAMYRLAYAEASQNGMDMSRFVAAPRAKKAAWEHVFDAYLWARQSEPSLVHATDREVFDWIQASDCPIKVPTVFATFCRCLSDARSRPFEHKLDLRQWEQPAAMGMGVTP